MAQRRQITTQAGFGPPIQRSPLEKLRIKLKNAYGRNKGTLRNPEFWGLTPKLAAGVLNRNPRQPGDPVLFVSTHHKAMTTYFVDVMRLFAMCRGQRFQIVNMQQPKAQTDIFVSGHSKMDLPALAPYRGVHIMRDPRDMIISGYHYHKWTTEEWAHRPDDQGRSYQQKLLDASQDDGLYMDIDHFIFSYRDLLENWNMDDPDMLELKFEDLMGDGRAALYDQIFRHFGCNSDDLALGIRLMTMFEAKKRAGKSTGAKSHVRSAKSGQWKGMLTADHLAYIDTELGDVLDKFGYPRAT